MSGLRTCHTDRDSLAGSPAQLVGNETVQHDLHRFTDLARRPSPVGTLGGGGPGEARSPRLHEILAGQGFGRELRLALRSRGTLRGALVLLREHGRPPFTDEQASAAAVIAPPLTQAVRQVSLRPRDQPPPPLQPGVVIVGPDDTAEAISPQAAAWLSDFAVASEQPLPGRHRGDLQGALFGAAVAFVPGLAGDGDLPPGQGGQLGVQAGLVALDGDQVVRAALGDQVLGVSALGVQGIGSHDRPGQVDAVQQRSEQQDLVCLGLDVGLSQDEAVPVIECGQQMPAGITGRA
jgi:hypothetical protein